MAMGQHPAQPLIDELERQINEIDDDIQEAALHIASRRHLQSWRDSLAKMLGLIKHYRDTGEIKDFRVE